MKNLFLKQSRGMRIIVYLIVAGLIGIQGPLLSFAQEDSEQQIIELTPVALPTNIAKLPDNLISMDFQAAPLEQVLKVFSQQAGVNFVASEKIKDKKVTLFLDKVNVQDALNTILGANNLKFELKPGTKIYMIKEMEAQPTDMETRIYRLGYAAVTGAEMGQEKTGAGIEKIISQLLSKTGKLVIDPNTNSLIVTDTPEALNKIEKTLKSLDIKTPQVMISAEVLEVSISTLKRIGVEWGSDTGQFAAFTGGSRPTFWPFRKSLFSGATTVAPTMGSLNFSSFTAALKAIKTDTTTRYLARPKLLTLNNKAAEMKITTNAAVATNTIITSSGGTTPTTSTSLERYEVGTTLKVTPHINKDDYITMTVEPEVSRIKASALSTTSFDPYKRTAKTTIRIKDKETIVIAGLISREDSDGNRKVPLLGEVPLLGKMFNRDEKQRADTEILVFITPTIVKEDGSAFGIAMQQEFDSAGAGAAARETSFGFEQPNQNLQLSERDKKNMELKAHRFHRLVREQESPLSSRELVMEAELLKIKSTKMPVDKI